MVPNAVLMKSDALQQKTQYFLDFVIQNQASDGWLGPEVFDSSKPRYLWGRYAPLTLLVIFLKPILTAIITYNIGMRW